MTKQEMLTAMCLELGQADLKAIGQSRGFDPQTVASRALLEHVFLSEQGLSAALATLTEAETLGLHLLNCRGETVDLDFFKPVYPGLVPAGYYRSFTESHKGLFQKIKAQLVRRGILLCGTLQKHYQNLSVFGADTTDFSRGICRVPARAFSASRVGPGRGRAASGEYSEGQTQGDFAIGDRAGERNRAE